MTIVIAYGLLSTKSLDFRNAHTTIIYILLLATENGARTIYRFYA
jgi:hypothetical protein